ncbi:hypothetical protein EDC04DRAFT_2600348 [Pisolithus marmoratus]|nr:hypothetical protein EDC04DRAFT_2600348 [Pisolithus marmoratus]
MSGLSSISAGTKRKAADEDSDTVSQITATHSSSKRTKVESVDFVLKNHMLNRSPQSILCDVPQPTLSAGCDDTLRKMLQCASNGFTDLTKAFETLMESQHIAVETLLTMCSEVELARNTSLPNPQSAQMLIMTHASIGCKAKAHATAMSCPSHRPKKSPGSRIWQFDDMPDPDCHYMSLKSGHDLEDFTVHSPDVFDTNGIFIHVVEYNTKLLHEQVIEVDIILRLWTFKPSVKDLNGSCVYQLMLQSMKLMPYAEYVKNNLVYHSLPHTPNHKGKRKASISPVDQSPSKKNLTLREVEETASMHVDDM